MGEVNPVHAWYQQLWKMDIIIIIIFIIQSLWFISQTIALGL